MQPLTPSHILLKQPSESKSAVIARIGQCLIDNGHVESAYVEGMQAREASLSTYMGNGVAIPHGMPDYTKYILKSGMVIAQYPGGIDFGNGNTARLIIGIAGIGDDHMDVLSNVALICQYEENVERLIRAESADEILAILAAEAS